MGKCVDGFGDFGIPNCVPTNEEIGGMLFQQRESSSGVRNYLDSDLIGNPNYLIGLTNHLNSAIRIRPAQNIVEAVNVRGDSSFYTDGDNVEHFLKKGSRTVTAEILTGASPKLAGQIQTMSCNDVNVFFVGKQGGVFGENTDTTKLFGYEIVKGTLDSVFVPRTKDKVAHIMIKYTLSKKTEDKNILMYEAEDIGDNALSLTGLQEIDGVSVSASITEMVVDISQLYGNALTLIDTEDLLADDFDLAEISPTPGAATFTVTSVGKTYTFVVTSTIGDVHELKLTQDGFDKKYILAPVKITTTA